MVQHSLDRGYTVTGVCREASVDKLRTLKDRITIIPGMTNNREVVKRAVAECDGVLTVLAPWGRQHYSTGTAQAVLDYARPGARLIFSCGWHISRDGQDVFSRTLRWQERAARWIGRITRFVDYALFMVAALEDDAVIHEAPAIVGCRASSATANAA